MKLGIKASNIGLIVICILAFAALSYILFMINTNLPAALNVQQKPPGTGLNLFGVAHLLVFVLHLFALLYVFYHYKHTRKMGPFRVVLLIVLVISLFGMGVEKVMADEIARQLGHGMSIRELNILNAAYATNVIFSILTMFFLFKTCRRDSWRGT